MLNHTSIHVNPICFPDLNTDLWSPSSNLFGLSPSVSFAARHPHPSQDGGRGGFFRLSSALKPSKITSSGFPAASWDSFWCSAEHQDLPSSQSYSICLSFHSSPQRDPNDFQGIDDICRIFFRLLTCLSRGCYCMNSMFRRLPAYNYTSSCKEIALCLLGWT